VVIKKDDESESVNVRDLAWFKKTKAEMTPHENLKLLREERELTKKKLSVKAGIALTRISDYESGRVRITKAAALRTYSCKQRTENKLVLP